MDLIWYGEALGLSFFRFFTRVFMMGFGWYRIMGFCGGSNDFMELGNSEHGR